MAFADILGTSLFYESSGDGEPIVLVHGGFLDHSLWILTAPILAERFRVVAIDLPGHGQSGGTLDPTATPREAMNLLADHLVAVVEQLGLGPAHFVGQSAGGAALLHLGVRRPDLVRTMNLHEPATVALLDDEFAAVRDAQIEAFSLLTSGDIEAGLRTFVGSVGGDWSLMPEPFRAIFRQNAPNYAGAAFFADPARAVPVPDGLDAFRQPVLFTKGERSPRFFHVSIDRVAAMLPDAEIAMIEGGSHAAMLERPAEYAALVTEFIARNARRVTA